MDTLLLAIISLAGLCSYAFCTMRQRASFGLALFAWTVAMPWLAIYSVLTLWSIDNLDLFEWGGDAQIGPLTLIFAVLGISLLALGGQRNAGRN